MHLLSALHATMLRPGELISLNVGDFAQKPPCDLPRGVVVIRWGCSSVSFLRSCHFPQHCRQQELGSQSLPSYPTQWPRSWGLVGGTLSPRAFLISPGASRIFRGRPGFLGHPHSLARGFRLSAGRGEGESWAWVSLFLQHPLCVCLLSFLLRFFFLCSFSLFNIRGSFQKSDFSGHGILSTLDGKKQILEHISALVNVSRGVFLGVKPGAGTRRTKRRIGRHNSTLSRIFLAQSSSMGVEGNPWIVLEVYIRFLFLFQTG